MIKYSDLGLVNSKEMFVDANSKRYAVPAFNFISIEQYNAIIDACIEKNSPVILLVSPNLLRQYGGEIIARISQSGVERARRQGIDLKVCLHLDHGMSYKDCEEAISFGFSSVMIDGSQLPFRENIKLTKSVVELAKNYDVSVEAELGSLSGTEEEGEEDSKDTKYTDPDQAIDFIKKTKVDSLAVSIGTNHGLVKMKLNEKGEYPRLKFDILNNINESLPNFPIVLHGSSNLDPKIIEMANNYGGTIEKSVGIPDDQISEACKLSVTKVNIASDGWITALALTRKILAENPQAIDSRVFKLKIRPVLKDMYCHKIDIFGSGDRL